ncbi:WD repeat-containing protein 7-like isoform X2 [Oppia nitens]|uniref:WD repeat-containing protein 7-like isoform X2 n=1 Tax=Oppia nitens TaxID=1686743 RepID=UPI0023DABC8F|nr:WD repeat-containing protein 7-like isoform X2 [Oppia nitens]
MTVIGLSNQLIVPITLWGSQSPTHCISCVLLTNDYKTVVTGCNDGQICLWDCNSITFSLTPRSLLFGHSSPVLCLANGKQTNDNSLLVSSSESGEMSLWDLSDGRCLESIKMQCVHTNIQTYELSAHEDLRLFCNGYYAEILIMDVTTLEVLYTLTSKVNPDWISAIHVLKPVKRQEDVVIGISIAGVVKVWTMTGQEMRSTEPIYENESKPIRCLNAIRMTCCIYNQRTVLVVCTKYWQIYDAGDFSLLCSVDSRRGERWSGGDFLSADRIIVWSDAGKGYLYKLPVNKLKGKAISCIPENKEFHSPEADQPFLYSILSNPEDERLLCPPAMNFYLLTRNMNEMNQNIQKLLIRGDSYGKVIIWSIPDVSHRDVSLIRQESETNASQMSPTVIQSLDRAWKLMDPLPCGILDQLIHTTDDTPYYKLTASVYLPQQGRLVCGREDGSIIIVSASQTIMLQFLVGKHLTFEDWPHHQILIGHSGRVNCLLYPHHMDSRYEISHLVSGGVDFSVCVWDIYAGTLLHRFSVHAGEINQLFAPPKECNPRILQCICSVASDHSVALLSLKERKCIMLASRHLFPIHTIKWRPLDDFMIVGCVDGSVYVWQMETGHLDRVVHGIIAEEILSACDENVTSAGDRLTNPAIHLFRGLRHRNLAAIRHAAVRGLHNISSHLEKHKLDVVDMSLRSRSQPLMIQGLRTNPKDQDSHVLFFDVEALIVQLMHDEYSAMTPNTLENHGLTNTSEYQKFYNLSCSPETQHKLTGFLNKVKDTAENAAQKIQAKADSIGFKNVSGDITVGFYRKSSTTSSDGSRTDLMTPSAGTKKPAKLTIGETNLTMDIARLLLSLLHAWGLDSDLDKVCESKLGLLRPLRPICFGMISRGGHMSLILPTYVHQLDTTYYSQNISVKQTPLTKSESKHVRISPYLPSDLIAEEEKARRFSSRLHWELSTAITTNHLLSTISLAKTLMSMSSASFIPESERKRKLHRKASRTDSKVEQTDVSEAEHLANQQQQIKQGWSLLAALHCVLLPDLIKSNQFQRPLVEILARRWQDRCLEVREAAQALLLAELRRVGSKGRKQIVDEWATYLPNYSDQIHTTHPTEHHSKAQSQSHSISSSPSPSPVPSDGGQNIYKHSDLRAHDDNLSDEDEDPDEHSIGVDTNADTNDISSSRMSSFNTTEGRRKQATAIVLLGVIGSEYGHEVEQSKRRTSDENRRKSLIEGFGPGNYTLARNTSKALAYLLLSPPSPSLPLHTSLRRAAIDLIGRGFTVWEPYLDVSKILLGLLELCCESENLVPSMSFGLPLTPAADSCRTARHAISLIATARPAAFITCLAKEVARYNTIQQNAQSLNVALHQTVLCRGRPEILRNMEILIEKMQTEVSDLIIEAMDIIIHSLDHNMLKTKGLGEVYPTICRFQNVTYCTSSRRIAVGAKNGNLAIYELRTPKSQVIPAHTAAITCCSFSPDGKHLASYSSGENKVSFWLTAVGLFGLGNAQTRCVKTYSAPPMPEEVKTAGPQKMAKFVWIGNKTVIIMFANGKEFRFNV